MADNPTTPIADGTTIATDEIGGAHYQRVKTTFGTDGTATDVSAANPLPVTIGAGPFAVTGTFYQATQPVSGTVSVSNFPATQPISGNVGVTGSVAVTGTFWQATQPVSGTVSISGSVAVTGTFWQATQPVSAASLPLPTGASTAAKQDEAIALLEAGAALDAAFAITPHATDPLERETKAIAIVTGGTVVYRHPDEGSDRTVTLPAGFFPLRATHIRATSTAVNLTGF